MCARLSGLTALQGVSSSMEVVEVEVGTEGPLGLNLEYSEAVNALVIVSIDLAKVSEERTRCGITMAQIGDAIVAVDGVSVLAGDLDTAVGLLQQALSKPKDDNSRCMRLARPQRTRVEASRPERMLRPRLAVSLEASLRQSSFFEPLHVEVSNESYWYQARRELGGRRHMAREIVELTGAAAERMRGGVGYEAFYYALAPDESTGALNPQRLSAGSAPNAKQAWLLADAMCRSRDRSKTPIEAEDLLNTHLKVIVVSPTFVGLDQPDRAELVVEALLEKKGNKQVCADRVFSEGINAVPAEGEMTAIDDCRWVPARIPRGFLIGPSVFALPFHARLARLGGTELILHLLTPAQWQPNKFHAAPVEQRDDRRLELAILGFDSALKSRLKAARSSKVIRDMIVAGPEDENEARRHDPLFGHFFHSLSAEHRKYLVQGQRAANAALERARTKSTGVRDSATVSRTRINNVATIFKDGAPRRRKGLVAEQAASRHAAALKLEAECATRLQRIFRRKLFLRAFRRRNRRHLAATRIQRTVRGFFGSVFARLYKQLLSLAVTRIACRYRILAAIRRTQSKRTLFNTAAVSIERAERGRRARVYVSWVRLNWHKATQLNRVARGFLARCTFNQLFIKAHFRCDSANRLRCRRPRSINRLLPVTKLPLTSRLALKPLAAARLQAMARQGAARVVFLETRAQWIDETVVQPARLKLQKVWRGALGRLEARLAHIRRGAATQIQRRARGRRARLWKQRIQSAIHRKCAATWIQCTVRGYLDRCVVLLMRRDARRRKVQDMLIPAVQALVRRELAKSRVMRIRIVWRGAILVQRAWRAHLATRSAVFIRNNLASLKRAMCASVLQRRMRGYLARRHYSFLWHATAGARFRSARIIFRAWKRYRVRLNFAQVKAEWVVDRSTKELARLRETRDDIKRDIEDVRADMKDVQRKRSWACKRLKQLAAFILQAELRLPRIEAEIDNLELADIEAGWGEAFEHEWQRLDGQALMAKEEERLHKVALKRYDEQLLDLQLESEDLEIDLDDISVAAAAESESQHRLNIASADKLAVADKNRRIMVERMRWKVRDVRVRVLERDRPEMARLFEHAVAPHRVEHSQLLSYKKRKKIEDRVRKEALSAEASIHIGRLEKTKTDSDCAVENLKDTYDRVVVGCASLLRSATLDYRTNKNIY